MIFRKTNNKYFQILGSFWTIFFQTWGKMYFLEKRALSVYKYSKYLPCCKKSEKITTHSGQKFRTADGQTDRGQWFYRIFRRARIQKVIFKTEECDSL